MCKNKTMIVYKIKTVHHNDFLKALIICKSAISYTFGIVQLFDISTLYPLFAYPQSSDFVIFAYRVENNWRSINFNHSFCTVFLYGFCTRCCIKTFPMNFWRHWHLFEYQKRPNRIINNKVTEFCKLLSVHYIFCKRNRIFISYQYWNILSWVLPCNSKKVKMVPPLL